MLYILTNVLKILENFFVFIFMYFHLYSEGNSRGWLADRNPSNEKGILLVDPHLKCKLLLCQW